jgi:two pore calcium channel protein, plant
LLLFSMCLRAEVMESAFTVIYVVEAGFKISVYGWRTYCDKIKNIFDFSITMLAVASSAVIYYPNDYSDSRLIRMILSARVLRLVRILTALKPFQQIGKISAVILPAAKNVFLVLFITMYIFAVLGMHLYGGMITRDPNNRLSFLLLNTDFSGNEYWANNFNDMIGGMNVLFNLLVVNNWFVCEEGYEAVTQGKWVRLFFFSFHVIGVILVNNLVIAFIINKFLQQMTLLKQESTIGVEHIGPSVHIGEDRAIFDASKVTGTVTNIQGDYIARFRQSSSDIDDEQRDRERLRTLFSQS